MQVLTDNEVQSLTKRILEIQFEDARQNKLTSEIKAEIKSVYHSIFDRKLKKECNSCYFDAYIELSLLMKENSESKKTYKLPFTEWAMFTRTTTSRTNQH